MLEVIDEYGSVIWQGNDYWYAQQLVSLNPGWRMVSDE